MYIAAYSEFPAFLVENGGFNSGTMIILNAIMLICAGFMLAQVTAAALGMLLL